MSKHYCLECGRNLQDHEVETHNCLNDEGLFQTPPKVEQPTIWVLTNERNDYDQYGEYFMAAFLEKPTKRQLQDAGVCPNKIFDHVLAGGGRQDSEDKWYFLRNLKSGETI